MKPILAIEHLSIDFIQYDKGLRRRVLPVIRDLSLTVEAGQVVAVVGASGSGKSLLTHAILDILPYNSRRRGTILFDGEELTPKRAAKLRGREIALVPQGVTYLDPLMKVGTQLRRGRRDGDTKKKYRDALARYGLDAGTEGLYPFELSGGMARRVLIASAVAENPRLIIADEPTPGLDAQAAARILAHFRELADGGAGVLFITHDLEIALEIADKVAVFYAGETIEEAAAGDFVSQEHLRHPFTKALWNAMPRHGFHSIAGTQPYPGETKEGCPFARQCGGCTPECRFGGIELRPFQGGLVRCLHPGMETEIGTKPGIKAVTGKEG